MMGESKTLPLPKNCDEELQYLLADIYLLMNYYLSGGGSLNINRDIEKKVKMLNDNYRLSKNDILHSIYLNFISKEHFYKIDLYKPEKKRTFTAHYTNYMLNDLIKKYQRVFRAPDSATESFEQIYEENIQEDRIGYPLAYWEKRGLTSLTHQITPEDEFLGQELQEIIDQYFDGVDWQVASGHLNRREAAAALNLKYDTFCKRFRRKLEGFYPILASTGYIQ